jgi:2-keto-4-pentenoate hydratase/2-oxohepta-3-ene-1,7-dioic acid hydratase in catechol pathway
MSLDPLNVKIQCRVNGKIMQSFSSSEFLFSIYDLVSYASRIMTLEPGDLVISGSDPSLHPIRAGDTVEVEIEGIGVLKNPVVTEVQ